jgi:hypothetical protein
VLRREDHRVDGARHGAVVAEGDLGLAVGAEEAERARAAGVGEALARRCAVQIAIGMSCGVSVVA